MTDTEIAWVAALLDGEGYFELRHYRSKNGDTTHRGRISCNMCDEDVLQKLQKITGGTLCGPYKNGKQSNRKPIFRWNLHKQVDVVKLCLQILPYMGKRRAEKIRQILQYRQVHIIDCRAAAMVDELGTTTPVGLAWVAGILEGEGAFIYTPKTSTDGSVYYAYIIGCGMCDFDVIHKLADVTGMGTLTGPVIPKNPKHRAILHWRLNKRKQILELCKLLLPHMGQRRSAKIAELFNVMTEHPAKPTWQHGTRRGYELGCKCADCKAAHAKRFMARRRKRGIRPRNKAEHGTRSMYVRHKCRCKACTQAGRDYQRARAKARNSCPLHKP